MDNNKTPVAAVPAASAPPLLAGKPYDPKDSSKWTPSQRAEYQAKVHSAYADAFASPDWENKDSEYYKPAKERGHCEMTGSMTNNCGCAHCTGQRAAAQVQADITGYDHTQEVKTK